MKTNKSFILASIYLMVFSSILFFQSCDETENEIPPLAPSNLEANANSPNQINLTWIDNSTNEKNFEIERKSGSDTYTLIGSTKQDITTYIDNEVSDNTTYSYRVYSINSAGKSANYSNEIVITTPKIESLAILSTTSVSSITPSSATSGGTISSDGNAEITARGVVWDTNPNPTIDLASKTNNGSGIGSFESILTNLNWNTTYYIRAYATNSIGTAYGEEISFSTEEVSLITSEVSNITPTTAYGGGTVGENAGSSIISKGLVWSKEPNPTINLSTKTDEGTNTGSFNSMLFNLNVNTTYYIRMYASTEYETFYGNEITFNTLSDFSFKSIASGLFHSMAVQDDGTLWAWGSNGSGQLGTGDNEIKKSPVIVATGFEKISAGYQFSVGIKSDGTLWTWGENDAGQIGDGTYQNKNSPVNIGDGFIEVSAGHNHVLAIKTDGTLWAWGNNEFGQLGDGSTENKNEPVLIGSGFSKIAAGLDHSLAIKNDGTLWAWGRNNAGQLGDGTSGIAGQKLFPIQVGENFKEISGGYYHTLAIGTNNKLWAWGGNYDGQLGNNDTGGFYTTPVEIGDNFSLVSTFSFHSLSIDSDGNLWSWGKNGTGQLGDNTTSDKNAPIQIGSNFILVNAGFHHTLSLKNDGTIWGWGYNDDYQLGNRSTEDSLIPIKVNF